MSRFLTTPSAEPVRHCQADAAELSSEISDFNSAWGVTMPAELVCAPEEAGPFQETITGLVTREVNEPDLFKHFFG